MLHQSNNLAHIVNKTNINYTVFTFLLFQSAVVLIWKGLLFVKCYIVHDIISLGVKEKKRVMLCHDVIWTNYSWWLWVNVISCYDTKWYKQMLVHDASHQAKWMMNSSWITICYPVVLIKLVFYHIHSC